VGHPVIVVRTGIDPHGPPVADDLPAKGPSMQLPLQNISFLSIRVSTIPARVVFNPNVVVKLRRGFAFVGGSHIRGKPLSVPVFARPRISFNIDFVVVLLYIWSVNGEDIRGSIGMTE
jgi:hypothetical protein